MTNLIVPVVAGTLLGMVISTCWEYRRSKRMGHILPLGISYLILVGLSAEAFWSGYRVFGSVPGGLLCAAYAAGIYGLLRLVGTSIYLDKTNGDEKW